MILTPNDEAPSFTLQADNEQKITLDSFPEKNIVIYFYPKDNTPGCTTESRDFAARYETFDSLNTVILGVSKDSITSHQKFKTKQNLPFLLLSDPDGKMCEAYGAWGEKSMFGKKYMGIVRSTFIIDAQKNIRQAWYKVKVKGHADAVLAAIQEIDKS